MTLKITVWQLETAARHFFATCCSRRVRRGRLCCFL